MPTPHSSKPTTKRQAKSFLCAFGDCHDEHLPIVVTILAQSERVRFCSFAHLIAWAEQELTWRKRNAG